MQLRELMDARVIHNFREFITIILLQLVLLILQLVQNLLVCKICKIKVVKEAIKIDKEIHHKMGKKIHHKMGKEIHHKMDKEIHHKMDKDQIVKAVVVAHQKDQDKEMGEIVNQMVILNNQLLKKQWNKVGKQFLTDLYLGSLKTVFQYTLHITVVAKLMIFVKWTSVMV